MTEPTERAGWLQGQALHCSVARSCLFPCPYSVPGIMDLENVGNRNAEPGSAGVGGAQGGGDVFGEVRVSGLVTITIRTEEKHLGTQICAHLTRVG